MPIRRVLKVGPIRKTTWPEPGHEETLAEGKSFRRSILVESPGVVSILEINFGYSSAPVRHYAGQINEAGIKVRRGFMRTVEFGFVPSKERY